VDEANPLKPPATQVRHLAIGSCLFFFSLALGACASREPSIAVTTPEEAFTELAKSVAQWRELPLARELRLQVQTGPSGMGPDSGFYGAASIAQMERTFKSIAVLAKDDDLAKALVEYQRLSQLISYDRATDVIAVARDARRLGAPLAQGYTQAAHDLAPAIGVVQALQEQRFQWRATVNAAALQDRRLALEAVGIGDALLTAVSRVGASGKPDLSPATLGLALQVARQLDRLASALPKFLREQITLPYRDGSQFVYWAFAARGWPGVNGLYGNLPTTTAQILHPQKYFIHRQPPLRFFPPALLRRFKNQPLLEQSLGEALIRTVLEREHGAKDAADTVAAWNGDQLFSFQTEKQPTIFWYSSWDNDTSARQFLRSYKTVLERGQSVRFESIALAQNSAEIATAQDGRAWLMQTRGSVAITLHGAPSARLTGLAAEAWQDLEIAPESTMVRFESSQRSLNFR
jgi:hypothetical protein